MLVHDFAYVDLPAAIVKGRILDDAGAWLGNIAAGATREGEELRVRLGPRGMGALPAKEIAVDVGEPLCRQQTTVIPLSWRATGVSRAFPAFRGDLDVSALGDGDCQLTIWGQYEPPLGAVGRRLDQFLLHRVAEASVRAFLRGLADGLNATAREHLVA